VCERASERVVGVRERVCAHHHQRSREVLDIAGQLSEALVRMHKQPAVDRVEELGCAKRPTID
jgi:hypothetical protein